MRARIIVAVSALSVFGVACADLFGFKELTEGEASVPDANVPDVAPDVDTCPHARWPAPPANGPTGTANAYTLALRHVHFTTAPDGGPAAFGYDLDDRCTVDPASVTCKAASPTLDGVGGVDNESIALMNTVLNLGVTSSLSDQSINDIIDTGAFTMLFRIFGLQSDTNQPPSQTLKIAVQASPGLVTAPPVWDGTDRWYPSGDDVVGGVDGGTNTPNRLISAYITNGVLVATDPKPVSLTLYLPPGNTLAGPLHVTLNEPVLTAKLVKRSDNNYDLTDGIIAGRWAADDMLRTVADLTINNTSLCTYLSGNAFTLVAQQVCGARDITSSGVDDGTATCDALSVAVAFDAVAAQVSGVPKPFPQSTTPCADAGLCGN
jgi:hypothetical protein